MRLFYQSLAALWRHRRLLVGTIILVPVLVLLHGMSQPAQYQATAILNLDNNRATTPLLSQINNPEHEEVLYRILTNQRLVEDTLNEVGVLNPEQTELEQALLVREIMARIQLEVLSDTFVQVSLSGDAPAGLVSQLETLIFNFIYEVLAPERFRTDQQLLGLEEQIKHYRTQVRTAQLQLSQLQQNSNIEQEDEEQTRSIVTAEFNLQRAQAQFELVQNEYEQLLASANQFRPDRANVLPSGLIWFAEAPRVEVQRLSLQQLQQRAWWGLIGGVLLGILFVILARLSDRTLRDDESIMRLLGLPILGRLPDLGPVKLDHGHVVVDAQIMQRST